MEFDVIRYLAGILPYVFDRDVLENVAMRCGVDAVTSKEEFTPELHDRCKMALLETMLLSPSVTATHNSKHGEWQEQIGSQTLNASLIKRVKEELKRLYRKYDMLEKLESLDNADATLQWL